MITALEEARKMAAALLGGAGDGVLEGRKDSLSLVQTILAAIELGERREREAAVKIEQEHSVMLGFCVGLEDHLRRGAPNTEGEALRAMLKRIVSTVTVNDAIERGDHHPAAVEAVEQKERM